MKSHLPGRLIFLLLFHAFYANCQTFQFSEPQKLTNQINSDAEESYPIITSDGSTLFFVRSFHPENVGGMAAGQDIWISIREEDEWLEPHNSTFKYNDADHNAVIGIAHQQSGLYLFNAYPSRFNQNITIAYSKFSNGEWGIPQKLLVPGIEPYGRFLGFYVHPDEDLILISMQASNSAGQEDLYVSMLNRKGKWSEPIWLGKDINTTGFEISPFITQDKKRLFFSSNGYPDSEDADIYVSERIENWQKWTKPKKLENINSPAFDAYFYYSEAMAEAYFVSNRGKEYTDIYMAKLDQSISVQNQDSTQKSTIEYIEFEELYLYESDNELNNEFAFESKGSAFIYFEFASDKLTDENKNLLKYISKNLDQNNMVELELLGYADDLGSTAFNQDLSRRRALSVKTYLMNLGISETKIKITPMGEIEADNSEDIDEIRRMNRRVELVVRN